MNRRAFISRTIIGVIGVIGATLPLVASINMPELTVRISHNIPVWVDILKLEGNAIVPQNVKQLLFVEKEFQHLDAVDLQKTLMWVRMAYDEKEPSVQYYTAVFKPLKYVVSKIKSFFVSIPLPLR